jgi:hypothetical protein
MEKWRKFFVCASFLAETVFTLSSFIRGRAGGTTGFSLGRFSNFSSLRDVVLAMFFAAAPPNSQNSTMYVVIAL